MDIFRQPLLVFDGESFWHVLHGSLPRIFGGQFIQFRKKAEDVCKRLTSMGFKLSFVFGNSPISADAKVDYLSYASKILLRVCYKQLKELFFSITISLENFRKHFLYFYHLRIFLFF